MLLLEEIFQVINDSGLNYCIQNKYEMMPEQIPSDIDMMYKDVNEKFLDTLINTICKKTNGKLVQKYVQGFYQYSYILFYKNDCEKYFQIPLDFYRTISWKGYFNVMMAEEMLETKRFYKCFYVPDNYTEFKYMWIRRTIKDDLNAEHIDIAKQLYSINPEHYKTKLIEDFGKAAAEIAIQCMQLESVKPFNENKDVFKAAVKKRAESNNTLMNKLLDKLFLVTKIFPRRIAYHCGISIAFLSPDGGGKTTIIHALNDYFDNMNIFDGVRNYYMRPQFLKNLGHYNKINPSKEESTNPDPHGKAMHSVQKSLIRFMFYNVDYVLGTLVKIWPHKLAKKLVIFDRYYYDYFVDLTRYQYSFSEAIPKAFRWMIPQPEMVFILDAPSEVLYARKQELTLDELKEQRIRFKQIPSMVPNAKMINVDRPIEEIVDEIICCIVELQEIRTWKIYRGVK